MNELGVAGVDQRLLDGSEQDSIEFLHVMLLHFFVIRPSEAVGQSIGRASVLVEEHEIAKEPLELDEDDAHFNLGICRRQEAKLVGCYAEDAVFKVPRRS